MKNFLIIFLTVILVFGLIFLFKDRAISAQEGSAVSDLDGKLSQILRNQENILNKLEEIFKQLEKIKIRATIR